MARQKKSVHRVEMTEGKRNIIRQLLEEYDIETAEVIIPELFGSSAIIRCIFHLSSAPITEIQST